MKINANLVRNWCGNINQADNPTHMINADDHHSALGVFSYKLVESGGAVWYTVLIR